jgi:hypothetical protein
LKKMNARTTQALWTNWQVLHCNKLILQHCTVLYFTALSFTLLLCVA